VLQLAGLLPIELVLFKEYFIGSLFRLNHSVTLENTLFEPYMVELKLSSWFLPPYYYYVFHNIILKDPNPPENALHYYTDGAKMDDGVGS